MPGLYAASPAPPTPFGGDGVNLAMLDATELPLALAADDALESSLAHFRATLLERYQLLRPSRSSQSRRPA